MTVVRRFLFAGAALSLSCYLAFAAYLYLTQESLIFIPKPLPEDHVFSFDRPFREHTLTPGDGSTLSAVSFLPTQQCTERRGTVLFFHGNGSNIAQEDGRATDFTDRCWRALFVDYRPFGKSRGELRPDTLLLDAQAARRFIAEESSSDRVVVYGNSLGTAVATALAATMPELSALILEAPFLSIEQLATERYPWSPISLILRFPMRSDSAIPMVSAPVFIVHGTADERVPIHHGRGLATLAQRGTLIELPGGTHFNVRRYQEFERLLDSVLGAKMAP